MNLTQKAITGTKWSSLSTIVRISMQIIRMAILARFLDASDFGLSAIVLMVLGFTNIFSDFGINIAILHKQEISTNEYSSLYWLNIVINIGLYLVLLCLAPVFAYFYEQSELIKLISLAGLDLLIIATGKQFQTVLQKQLDFKIIAVIDIAASGIALIIAYFTASTGFGVYSIIISGLSLNLIRSLLFIIYGKHPIKIRFKLKETYSFLKIGIYQTGAQILDYASNYADIFIIGKFFSLEQLGYYTLAKELIIKPYQAVNSSVNSIVISYLSKLQNDLTKIKRSYLRIVKGVSFINFPVYFFLIFFSDIIVSVYYGKSYAQVAHFVGLLGFWGMFASIGALIGNLTFALGRTDLNFKWTVVRVCINPVVLVVTSIISINALAIGQSILGIVFFYLAWLLILRRLINLSCSEYISEFKVSLLLSLLSALTTRVLFSEIYWESLILNLITVGVLFTVLYLGLSYFFNNKVKAIISKFIK